MKTPNLDVDPFIEALRGDLPSAADEARVRAKLLCAGVVVGGAAVAAPSGAVVAAPSGAVVGAPSGVSLTAGAAHGAFSAVPGGAIPGGLSSGGMLSNAALSGAGGLNAGGLGAGLAPGGVASGGVASGGVASGGVASGGVGAAGAPALVKTGLLAKIVVLPVGAKLGMATTLAVAVAASSVPFLSHDERAANPVHVSDSVSASGEQTAIAAPADRRPASAPPLSSPALSSPPPSSPAPLSGSPAVDEQAVETNPLESLGGERAESLRGRAPSTVGTSAIKAHDGETAQAAHEDNRGVAASPSAFGPDIERGPGSVPGAAPGRRERTRAADISGRARSNSAARRQGSKAPLSVTASVEPEGAARVAADGRALDGRALGDRALGDRALGRGRTELVYASSLAEETRLIERALLALGEGDTGLARRTLDEHARRFPDGLLVRERARAEGHLRELGSEQR